MAIYHLTAKMVKRSDGRNAVGAAAYRSGSSLYEEKTGITHDYTRKAGVAHTEILAPENAPGWVFDRQTLWNKVEAAENRKDSQVAREIEIGLPIELNKTQQIALLRDFVQREFVSKGMVADFAVHLDNEHNPHAHILLTLRTLENDTFDKHKARGWNEKADLLQWRRGWAEVTNEHLAEAGLGLRIDHRSYREQGIDLIPGRKIGLSLERQKETELPGYLSERIAEQHHTMAANGAQIIADPTVALQAVTKNQATFTRQDLARFLNTHTDGAEQFQTALLKVTASKDVVYLGRDDQEQDRYTTRAMLQAERSLLGTAETLTERGGHAVAHFRRENVLSKHTLSDEQRRAFEHTTAGGDLKIVVGVAGSGKSTALAAMREAWEGEGYTVKGATLAGIAAENLQGAAGIQSRTLTSYENSWEKGRDLLTAKDVLVIDEAGLLGTRQLGLVLEAAEKARAKVVLVGDPEQLQAIEAGAAFRGLAQQHGATELTEVRRQKHAWQRQATQALAAHRTREALATYHQHGGIVAVENREQARQALVARHARDAAADPKASRLVLAYTRAEVHALNAEIRALRQQKGELSAGQLIQTETGQKEFAVGDRLYFLRNERELGVKNGSLGTVEKIDAGVLQIKLDGRGAARVAVDTKFYKDLDYGYAATVHKAQGTTVDRSYVLATPHFDRNLTYVALSRHRESATVFYAADDFGGRQGQTDAAEVRARFNVRLSRPQPKELAHDYLERASIEEPAGSAVIEKTLSPAERFAARLEQHQHGERSMKNAAAATPAKAIDSTLEPLSVAERFKARLEATTQRVLEERAREQASSPKKELARSLEKDLQKDLDRGLDRSQDRERDWDLGL